MLDIQDDRFFPLVDIRDGLNISLNKLRYWIRTGELKSFKIGRNYVVKGDHLKEFMKKGSNSDFN